MKSWPENFSAVLDGRKAYEIRKNDRGFAERDELLLREWRARNPVGGQNCYTGRELLVRVTHKSEDGAWGLAPGHTVLGIAPVGAVHALTVDTVAKRLHELVYRPWVETLVEQGGLTLEAQRGLEQIVSLPFDKLHPYGQDRARAYARRLLGDENARVPTTKDWTPTIERRFLS